MTAVSTPISSCTNTGRVPVSALYSNKHAAPNAPHPTGEAVHAQRPTAWPVPLLLTISGPIPSPGEGWGLPAPHPTTRLHAAFRCTVRSAQISTNKPSFITILPCS